MDGDGQITKEEFVEKGFPATSPNFLIWGQHWSALVRFKVINLIVVVQGLQSKFINDLLLTKRVNRDDLENYDGTAVPISL